MIIIKHQLKGPFWDTERILKTRLQFQLTNAFDETITTEAFCLEDIKYVHFYKLSGDEIINIKTFNKMKLKPDGKLKNSFYYDSDTHMRSMDFYDDDIILTYDDLYELIENEKKFREREQYSESYLKVLEVE